MLATLCYYESRFEPYHPHTLRLMAQVADVYWKAGDLDHARPLLQRVVKDLGRCLIRDHELRLRAIGGLRDLLVVQGDYESAAVVQRELLEMPDPAPGERSSGDPCDSRRSGDDVIGRSAHPIPSKKSAEAGASGWLASRN